MFPTLIYMYIHIPQLSIVAFQHAEIIINRNLDQEIMLTVTETTTVDNLLLKLTLRRHRTPVISETNTSRDTLSRYKGQQSLYT